MRRAAAARAPEPQDEALAQARAELAAYRGAMRRIGEVCRAAAQGDLEARITDLEVDAEVDEIRHAVNHMLDLTDAFVRESVAALAHASDGRHYRRVLTHGMLGAFRRGAQIINAAADAMQRKDEALRDAHSDRVRLADDFEAAVQSLSVQVAAAATEMRATARTRAVSTEPTATQSSSVAAAAAQASASVATVAEATAGLLRAAGEIERQVGASTQAARAAARTAERATGTVTGLDHASQQIGRVVTVITDVANQTRLLALNAAIEAARAGPSGRGFAVVASEVKNLATQTAEATQTIGAQIADIQREAQGAASAIREIGEQVLSLESISATIGRAVGAQRGAAHDISRSIQDTALAARAVSGSIEGVTGATQQTSSAAGQLELAAQELSRLGENLREEVEHFLTEIRG